ncbi:MAG: hypothetical protein KGJ86_00490 [Chloroflexota bacterium]|nr:hypothetical protein [Chloroflexota bacterium]
MTTRSRKRAQARAEAHVRQPYMRQIMGAHAQGRLPVEPGTAATLEVRHDNGCPRLAGRTCRCRPDVRLVMPDTTARRL